MKKTSLLTILALLVLSLTSFGQSSQIRTYKVKYTKIFDEGKLINAAPESQEKFVFDEGAKRIELKSGKGYQDRIFKIYSKQPGPVDEQCTVYLTQMYSGNNSGLVPFMIVLNRFYRVIKVAGVDGNENELRNYIEYQYE